MLQNMPNKHLDEDAQFRFYYFGPNSLRYIYIISVLLRTGTATPNLVHT